MPTYRNLEGLYRVMPDYRDCEWYRMALQQIESGIPYHHNIHLQARSQAELDGLFEHHFMPLLSSMAGQGYRHQEGADLPDGMVPATGSCSRPSAAGTASRRPRSSAPIPSTR